MRKVCAWCHKVLDGQADSPEEEISHGICPDCYDIFFSPPDDLALLEFLEHLPMPVLTVTDDVEVLAANKRAQKLTGITVEEMKGFRGGDLLQCKYSRLPGGCGRSEHCLGCSIRRTVEQTHGSGQPSGLVSAVQELVTDSGTQRVRFRIAARKYGDLVVLRVDSSEVLAE